MNHYATKMMLFTMALAGTLMAQTVVPDGTPVKLRLNEPLNSGRNRVGQGINLSVAEDVTIGEKVVIEAGSRATGQVTIAEPRKSLGRAGKIDFIPEKVQLADGRLVSLRATQQGFNGKGRGVTTGLVTAGIAIAFWPAAPVALLIKGKDVEIPPGVTFTSFTDAKFSFADATQARTSKSDIGPADAIKEARSATVVITSDADAAEIEVDGRFAGQSPATLNLSEGSHRVVLRSRTLVWERTVQLVAGNSISLKARLLPESEANRPQE